MQDEPDILDAVPEITSPGVAAEVTPALTLPAEPEILDPAPDPPLDPVDPLDGIVDDVAPPIEPIEPIEPDLAMEAGVFDDLDIVG